MSAEDRSGPVHNDRRTPLIRRASGKENRQKTNGEKSDTGPDPVLAWTSRCYVTNFIWKQIGGREYVGCWLGGLKRKKRKEEKGRDRGRSAQHLV